MSVVGQKIAKHATQKSECKIRVEGGGGGGKVEKIPTLGIIRTSPAFHQF